MTLAPARLTTRENNAPDDGLSPSRRHDVDCLRTLALGLLIIYHVMVSFQPWAPLIGFPRNEPSLEGLGAFMGAVNIWRIPILFLISGMGVRFAMEHRNWKQLLKDRTIRILVPFVSGIFLLGPMLMSMARHLGWTAPYHLHFWHLWFLANIYLYVLLLLPILAYLRNRPDNALLRLLSWLYRRPPRGVGLIFMALPLMVEAWLVDPKYFPLYALTPHGFFTGMICFLIGFVSICVRDDFWRAAGKIRWAALAAGLSLYLVRLLRFKLEPASGLETLPSWLIAFESMNWMVAILGFGSWHLNKPSATLRYFSGAVYPVYVVHLPVQFMIAFLLFSHGLPPLANLLLLTAGTFGISLLLYEYILRRIKWIRPLFGMKLT